MKSTRAQKTKAQLDDRALITQEDQDRAAAAAPAPLRYYLNATLDEPSRLHLPETAPPV